MYGSSSNGTRRSQGPSPSFNITSSGSRDNGNTSTSLVYHIGNYYSFDLLASGSILKYNTRDYKSDSDNAF